MKEFFQFFLGRQSVSQEQLSAPISIRIPQNLLEEMEIQSKELGGERYRSKHFINLLEIGTKYFSAKTEELRSLPLEQFNLHLRINYIFYKLNLNPSIIAENSGHGDVAKWCMWLEGKETPCFKELEKLAYDYCINDDWLKHGPKWGDHDRFSLFNAKELPSNCYASFYELARFIFNLRDEDVKTLKLIRSNETGEIIICVGYEGGKAINVFCPNFKLLNKEAVGEMGISYVKTLILFCAMFQKNICLLPDTYSIPHQYFSAIAKGQDTFQRITFTPEHAQAFNCSEQWAHLLYDQECIAALECDRIWNGGKEFLLEVYKDNNDVQRAIKEVTKILVEIEVSNCYFRQGIERFNNFYAELDGVEKSIKILDIPVMGLNSDNYLISGSMGSGFEKLQYDLILNKIRLGNGFIYINGTGKQDPFDYITNMAHDFDRENDVIEINSESTIEQIQQAVQNDKLIYLDLMPNKPIDQRQDEFTLFMSNLKQILDKGLYLSEELQLTIFTNEAVDYLNEHVGRFYDGWCGVHCNFVHTHKMSLEAKMEDPQSTNKAVYEILTGKSQCRIFYKPSNEDEILEITKKHLNMLNVPLQQLKKSEFAYLVEGKSLRFTNQHNFTFL